MVYDNLEDKSEVVAIDTQKHEVVHHWPVAPGEEPSGMAIDTDHHLLLIGCGNKTMVMMEATSGKVAARPDRNGVDATSFDPERSLPLPPAGMARSPSRTKMRRTN